MKIVRFIKDDKIKYGKVKKSKVFEIEGDIFTNFEITNKEYSLNEIRILPPTTPSKVVAVGLNYINHAKELDMKIPDEPILFIKPSTSVIGHNENIVYPSSVKRLDYEAELGILIKNKIRNIPEESVNENILGYTCANDVTARDLQEKDGQWTRCKSFDTFCPIGPYIVNNIDPSNLKIESYLNGEFKQTSNTDNFIFSVEYLVRFISNVMTLLSGDVIITGTPPGIGPMKERDEVEIKIEKVGTLRNSVSSK